MIWKTRGMAAVLACAAACGSARAQAAPAVQLMAGDRVAICGDSITEQKNYSVLIEMYLLACQPAADLQAVQFGWSGETTWGFVPRMTNDVLWLKPTVATIAYGMNDGGYRPVDAKLLADYRSNTRAIIQNFKQAGTRLIVIGGPGAVDSDAYREGAEAAKIYNATLATFGDAAREVAAQEGVVFANLHQVMADAMVRFKKLHPERSFVGGDGIHPDNVGHAVMAYAFLKAMGCDGDLGTITVDLANHTADATGGHRVVRRNANTITVESTRYPFHAPQDMDPTGVRAAMDVVPFEQDLNRFRLVATGIAADRKVKITWTEVPAGRSDQPPTVASNVFTAAELAAGINLSSAFPTTPFEHAWGRLEGAVQAQQAFETPLNKQWLHHQNQWNKELPPAAGTMSDLADAAKKMDERLRGASRLLVVPVTHTLQFDVQ